MNAKKIGIALMMATVIGVGAVGAQGNDNPPGEGRRPGMFQDGRPFGRGERDGLLRAVVEIVVDTTGLQGRDILGQVRDGSTLAAIITAQGGDVALVTSDIIAAATERINQAVANGRLTQERADEMLANLPDRVNDLLNGELRGEGRGERLRIAGVQTLTDAVMEATGLTRGQLVGQIIDGATLGEIVTANGGSVEAVIAAALADATTQVNEAVASGQITQEQANDLLARLGEAFQNAMNGNIRPARFLGGAI
jgi:uncharacterized coiled-coil protein SlyX